MPYKPLMGARKYNEHLAKGHSINRMIRGEVERITEGGISQAEMYQRLTAIALLTVRCDDVFKDLADFDR